MAREETVLQVEVTSIGDKMRKVGETETDGGHTVYSDEEVPFGGEGSAPWPLDYLLLSLGFCLLTQVTRCAAKMKIDVTGSKARVRGDFYEEGSVLKGTVTSACTGIGLELSLDSTAPPERIERLVEAAERNCFVSQAIQQPVPVNFSTTLNGAPLPAARGQLQ
jgi:uncharacterized OsmC-like protein